MISLLIFGFAGFALFPAFVKFGVHKLILAKYGSDVWVTPAYAILIIISAVLGLVAGSAAGSKFSALLSLTGGFVSFFFALGAFVSLTLSCRSIVIAYNKVV